MARGVYGLFHVKSDIVNYVTDGAALDFLLLLTTEPLHQINYFSVSITFK